MAEKMVPISNQATTKQLPCLLPLPPSPLASSRLSRTVLFVSSYLHLGFCNLEIIFAEGNKFYCLCPVCGLAYYITKENPVLVKWGCHFLNWIWHNYNSFYFPLNEEYQILNAQLRNEFYYQQMKCQLHLCNCHVTGLTNC